MVVPAHIAVKHGSFNRIRQVAPLIRGFLGPRESDVPQTVSWSVFAWLTPVTNTQTDRQTDRQTGRHTVKPTSSTACSAGGASKSVKVSHVHSAAESVKQRSGACP